MYKVAVVGDYDSIYGFAALGLETFPVSDVKETEKVFLELASGSYAVIYITEAAAAGIEAAIDRYREQPARHRFTRVSRSQSISATWVIRWH